MKRDLEDRRQQARDGVINVHESYTAEAFCLRTGLAKAAIHHAELDGLRTAFVGRRKYIRGKAWLDFLESREFSKKDLKDAKEQEGDEDD